MALIFTRNNYIQGYTIAQEYGKVQGKGETIQLAESDLITNAQTFPNANAVIKVTFRESKKNVFTISGTLVTASPV